MVFRARSAIDSVSPPALGFFSDGFSIRLNNMKPSSLATVLIRLVALYIVASGVFMFCAAFAVSFFMRHMIAQNGPPGTIAGKVPDFQFPASSVDTVFLTQLLVALGVVIGGTVLYKLSRHIGWFVGEEFDDDGPPDGGQGGTPGEASQPRRGHTWLPWER